MYSVNTMVRKLSFIEPTPKVRACVPAYFALIIIIVVHVVIDQSVLINTCRRQENLRISINKYMQKAGEPENDALFLKHVAS